MFIRRLCINKDGKSHFYFALVKSYRTARGPRQHVVAYLGDVKEAARLGFQQALQNQPQHQAVLFDESTPDWVEINVKGVKPERLRRLGDVWLALELLKQLKLDGFFRDVLASRRPKIPWDNLALILVTARFCEPKSELHIAEHFYSATALPDLLGIPAHEIYVNRLYRALDKVLVHKDALQRYLKNAGVNCLLLSTTLSCTTSPPRTSKGKRPKIHKRSTATRATIAAIANKCSSR